MNKFLTAVFEKSPYGYIGSGEELPGENTQGKFLPTVRLFLDSPVISLYSVP